jgi:hypothetical protein
MRFPAMALQSDPSLVHSTGTLFFHKGAHALVQQSRGPPPALALKKRGEALCPGTAEGPCPGTVKSPSLSTAEGSGQGVVLQQRDPALALQRDPALVR